MTGIMVSQLVEKTKMQKSGTHLPLIAVVTLLLILNLAIPTSLIRQSDLGVDWQGYKLPPGDLAVAQQIISLAPPGVMLGPPEISGLISILSPAFPQIIVFHDVVRQWLYEQGRHEEAEARVEASVFIGGWGKTPSSLEKTLSDNPAIRCIILRRNLLENKTVPAILGKHGYLTRRIIGEYVAAWK
jgi:hypothetical protein